MPDQKSIVSFYRFIDQARLPERADRSALGTLPTRSYRYCDAVTSASGYGWWVFSPMNFQLLFDGTEIFWHFDGAPDWLPLQPSAQFPNFTQDFDRDAPDGLQGCAPPFLTALPEPGTLQIWTGLMARTIPGWSLMVRPPVNLPQQGGYTSFEGIVETDKWFGPVFTNLRLTQTHRPIKINSYWPLLQIQPIPQTAYADVILNNPHTVPDMAQMAPEDWEAYRKTIVAPNDDPERPIGSYAISVRKQRRSGCPFAAAREAVHVT